MANAQAGRGTNEAINYFDMFERYSVRLCQHLSSSVQVLDLPSTAVEVFLCSTSQICILPIR